MIKRSKYGNRKTIIDGIKFDSIKEGEYYKHLKVIDKMGLIEKLELQVKFPYTITYSQNGLEMSKKAFYRADFVVTYVSDKTIGQKVAVIDVKGTRTAEYKRKKKIIEHLYKIKIIEV